MKNLSIVLTLCAILCPSFVFAQRAQYVGVGVGKWTYAWYGTDEEGFFVLATTPDYDHDLHPISLSLVGIKKRESESFDYQWGLTDWNDLDTEGEVDLSFTLDGKALGTSTFRGVGNRLYVHPLSEEPLRKFLSHSTGALTFEGELHSFDLRGMKESYHKCLKELGFEN
jgi:hypothetical protein